MLLSELDWETVSSGKIKVAHPAPGLDVYHVTQWPGLPPEFYTICWEPSPGGGRSWGGIDELTAQAILFHLTSEGKS